jgi:hypothetical protein
MKPSDTITDFPRLMQANRPAKATALLVALGTALGAHAADRTWTGAKDNDWHTPANWDPASGVPGKGRPCHHRKPHQGHHDPPQP